MIGKKDDAVTCFKELNTLLGIVSDPVSSSNVQLNARSKLGVTLFKCAQKDAAGAFNILVRKMEETKHTPGLSITLLACCSYVLDFLSPSERAERMNWALGPFLRHAVARNANHLSDLTRFFKSGGANRLPCHEAFVNELLLISEGKETLVGKPVGILIGLDSVKLSQCLWDYLGLREMNDATLALLAQVVLNGVLTPPSDEGLLKSVIRKAEENCDVNLEFAVIENALTVFRWLTARQLVCPDQIPLDYKNVPLRVLAIQCWAEYVEWGDLKKLPDFPESQETSIRKVYLKLMGNALKNEAFTFEAFHIPHWLWNDILVEFGVKKPEEMSGDGLYSLGNDELGYCCDIFHVLPEKFYVHCLRFQCKSPGISQRMIALVGLIPKLLLDRYFEDFKEFISFHLSRFPENAPHLAECVRSLASILLPRMTSVMDSIVSKIDYYCEKDLIARLTVLNTMFGFRVEVEPFMVVFDSIWEAMPYLNLSFSLCEVVINMFICIAPFLVEKADELYMFAFACICSLFKDLDSSMFEDFPNSMVIFEACGRFNSVLDADVVTNPHYRLSSSFPLMSLSLLLIKKLPKTEYTGLDVLFSKLPILLRIFPTESLALAAYYYDFLLKEAHKKALGLFCSELGKELTYNSETGFILLVSTFRMLIEPYMPLDPYGLLTTNIQRFSDDIYETRLTLQADLVLLPMIIMKEEQLSLLLECWAPICSKDLLRALADNIVLETKWKKIRIVRAFLSHFDYPQPKYNQYDSWIRRDFIEPKPVGQYLFDGQQDAESLDAVFDRFRDCYPIVAKPNLHENTVEILKLYKGRPELTALTEMFVKKFVNLIVQERTNSFWLFRYLQAHSIPFTFPVNTESPKCIALAFREQLLTETADEEDWMKIEKIRGAGSDLWISDIYEQAGLMSLALFMPRRSRLPIDTLKEMMKIPLSSVKQNILHHISTLTDVSDPQFLAYVTNQKDMSLVKFISSCDASNPLLFHALMGFIKRVSMMEIGYRISPDIVHSFIKLVLEYNKKIGSACMFEVLPHLDMIVSQTVSNEKCVKKLVKAANNVLSHLPMAVVMVHNS